MLLTELLQDFASVITLGYGRLLPDAMSLLSILATLEIAFAGIWWALGDGQKIEVELLRKIIQIGFFVWVVTNYQWLVEVIIGGFIHVGETAGGHTTGNLLSNPSAIADYGFKVTKPIFEMAGSYKLKIVNALLADVCALMILLSYFLLAIVVFVTYLEFYFVSVLGLILVPFGVFKPTAFLSEKVFGGVISYGVRLMVLAFILAIVEPVLANPKFSVAASPDLYEIFQLFLTVITIAALAWHAPSIASGLLAGAPSFTAGTAVGAGIAAGAGVAAMGAATVGAASLAAAGVEKTKAAAGAIKNLGKGSGSSSSSKSTTNGSNGAKSSGMGKLAQTAMLTQRAIPNDASPGASVSPTIRND